MAEHLTPARAAARFSAIQTIEIKSAVQILLTTDFTDFHRNVGWASAHAGLLFIVHRFTQIFADFSESPVTSHERRTSTTKKRSRRSAVGGNTKKKTKY
jgi:hypothetical protein